MMKLNLFFEPFGLLLLITDVCALMFLLIKWLFLVMCYISCDGLTDDVLFFFYVYLYIGCDTLIDDILFFGPFW